MFFNLREGYCCNGTTDPTIHYADRHLHFWQGIFAYSIYLNVDGIEGLTNFIQNLSGEYSECAMSKRNVAFTCKLNEDSYNIFIDSGGSRFIFTIEIKHVSNLVEYLNYNCKKDKL